MARYNLVDEWNHAWRWASVRCMTAALAIQGAWEAVPETLRDNLPHGMVTRATIALLVLGLIGRLVKKDVPLVPSESPAAAPRVRAPINRGGRPKSKSVGKRKVPKRK